MYEIGSTQLEEPKTLGDCWNVFEMFRLKKPQLPLDDSVFLNARRLVELNNAVYAKFYGEKEGK